MYKVEIMKMIVPLNKKPALKNVFDELSHDPHLLLGLHKKPEGVVRLWRPDAAEIFLEIQGNIVSANRVSDQGLFEIQVPSDLQPTDYRIYHASGLLAHDPYAFLPTLGEIDLFLFNKGVHYELYHGAGGIALHPSESGGNTVRRLGSKCEKRCIGWRF